MSVKIQVNIQFQCCQPKTWMAVSKPPQTLLGRLKFTRERVKTTHTVNTKQRATKEIPGSSQTKRGYVNSLAMQWILIAYQNEAHISFWDQLSTKLAGGWKDTAGKGEIKARSCVWGKCACIHWPCSLGMLNWYMQLDVVLLSFYVWNYIFVLLIQTMFGWDLPACSRGEQLGSGRQISRRAGKRNPVLLQAHWMHQPLVGIFFMKCCSIWTGQVIFRQLPCRQSPQHPAAHTLKMSSQEQTCLSLMA